MKPVLSRFRHKNKLRGKIVFTPDFVAQEIFEIVQDEVEKAVNSFSGGKPIILDPCVGQGALLKPFKKYFGDKIETVGIDIADYEGRECDVFIQDNWLNIIRQKLDFNRVIFTCLFPPFSDMQENPDYTRQDVLGRVNFKNKRNAFLPDIFFSHLLQYIEKPMVYIITPMGFRLNQRTVSHRRNKYIKDNMNSITGIVSYPIDIFPETLYHAEALIWNVPDIPAHTCGAKTDKTLTIQF